MRSGNFYGSIPATNRVWKVGAIRTQAPAFAPSGAFRVDPYLPSFGKDPVAAFGDIAIPAFRFVAIGYSTVANGDFRFNYTELDEPPITLYDGNNLRPAGIAIQNIFKNAQAYSADENATMFMKMVDVSVPYISAINDAHGVLKSGDFVTGYWGSVTTADNNAANLYHRGKAVKWNPKKLYAVFPTAGTTQQLTGAIYPGITPRVVLAKNAGVAVTGTPSLAWNNSAGVWEATFGSNVNEIVFEYGQDEDHIAGQVIAMRSLDNIVNNDGDFMRWVESDPTNYPVFMQRMPATQVTNETPTTLEAGRKYRVLNYPVSVWDTVKIEVQGTVYDKDGNATTYSGANWFLLPNGGNDSLLISAFRGPYHNFDWRTGVIELASNIVATNVRVTYSYITNPVDGSILWGNGQYNLTDAGATGKAGIPPHLNVVDSIGEIRIWVR